MKNNKKIFLIIIIMLFVNIVFFTRFNNILFAGLKDFKEDFNKEKTDNQKQNENVTDETKTETQTKQSNTNTQGTGTAKPDNSLLRNFYKDFKPPANQPGRINPPSTGDGNQYYYYYDHYPLDYYRYNYPYFYPYYYYYDYYPPRENIYFYDGENQKEREKVESKQMKEPERYTWYTASLDYQSVASNLNAVGMVFSLISSGKVDQISYGVKFDYKLFTEKDGTDYITLPLYDAGLVLGKQVGRGLVESLIAYCSLDDLSGITLKLSTDQWMQKNIFVSGELGISVINDAPLTNMFGGIGIGNSLLRFIVGYRSLSSVNYQLNGPEIKMTVVL